MKRGRNIPCVRPVDSYFVRLGWVVADIFDVAEDMSSSILADEVSQNSAESHVCHGRLMVPPFLNWEAFEQDETLAVQDLGSHGSQQG